MSELLYGSIDFTKLMEEAKAGHKAFHKSPKNGRVYVNINVWLNDQKDDYGNDASIQANFKEATKEDRFYFGNLRRSTGSAVSNSDLIEEDDLPDWLRD